MASWFQTFQKACGLRCFPAPLKNNDIDERITCVRTLLRRLIGGLPALRMNLNCAVLREGFQSGYKLKEFKTTDGLTYDEKPLKNEFSHIHDALQYACVFVIHAKDRLYDAIVMTQQSLAGAYQPTQAVEVIS